MYLRGIFTNLRPHYKGEFIRPECSWRSLLVRLSTRRVTPNSSIGRSSSRIALHPCRSSSRAIVRIGRMASGAREWTARVKIRQIAPSAISGICTFNIYQSCPTTLPARPSPHPLGAAAEARRPSPTSGPYGQHEWKGRHRTLLSKGAASKESKRSHLPTRHESRIKTFHTGTDETTCIHYPQRRTRGYGGAMTKS